MFLIRTAFWVGLVVLLLPTDEKNQARLAMQAQSALHWTWTFCDRNAQTCRTGQEAWATFLRKAEFGFALATGMVKEWSEKSAAHQAGEPPRGAPGTAPTAAPAWTPPPWSPPHRPAAVSGPAPSPASTQPVHRLKREDTLPPWRGPAAQRTGA